MAITFKSGRTFAKNVVELHPNLETLMAETDVQPQEDVVAHVESQAKSHGPFHVLEIPLRMPRKDFTGVPKQSHIQATEDFPSIPNNGTRHNFLS